MKSPLLYAYFHGDERRDNDQQIYFAVSEDGLHWDTLNDGQPILCSSVGDCGARDPFLVRCASGEVVLLATDLNTKASQYAGDDHAPDWRKMECNGRKDFLMWRTSDLVTWSSPHMVNIAEGLGVGNVWAPKATWVPGAGAYLAYWSSTHVSDGYRKQRLYAAWTRDFQEWSKPFVCVNAEHSCIDANITWLQEAGQWLLTIKNEDAKTIGMFLSPQLFDSNDRWAWPNGISLDDLPQCLLSSCFRAFRQEHVGELHGVEGPSLVLFPDNSAILYVDEYMGLKRGYMPLCSANTALENSFTLAGDYAMPVGARHGSVLHVSNEEYASLVGRWRRGDTTRGRTMR